MNATYEVRVDGKARFTFSADFSKAASAILLDGKSTVFQVADARHRPEEAAKKLINWCESEGGSSVGPDEQYTVEQIGL